MAVDNLYNNIRYAKQVSRDKFCIQKLANISFHYVQLIIQ